jgi:hypothetical protein
MITIVVTNSFILISDGYNSCEFKDDDDCIFYFTYNYDDDNELRIVAQRTKGLCYIEVKTLLCS